MLGVSRAEEAEVGSHGTCPIDQGGLLIDEFAAKVDPGSLDALDGADIGGDLDPATFKITPVPTRYLVSPILCGRIAAGFGLQGAIGHHIDHDDRVAGALRGQPL